MHLAGDENIMGKFCDVLPQKISKNVAAVRVESLTEWNNQSKDRLTEAKRQLCDESKRTMKSLNDGIAVIRYKWNTVNFIQWFMLEIGDMCK